MDQFFYPKLIEVEALKPYILHTHWNTDEILDVDIGDILKSIKCLAPIMDEETFKKVHICGNGQCIEWFDTEFSADNVYAWAIEQKGLPSHEMFHVWLYRNQLSITEAAQTLGISERLVVWYANARRKIPWHVWLACIGYDVLTNEQESEKINNAVSKNRMIEKSLKIFPVR